MKSNPPKNVTSIRPDNGPALDLLHYETLAASNSEFMWTSTLDGQITYVSPSVENLLGFSVEEAMSNGMLEYLVPESRARVLQMIEVELQRDGDPGADPNRCFQVELQEFNKSGSKLWIEVNATIQRDDEGRPMGILGTTRDITHKKLSIKMLKDSLECYQTLFDEVADAWIVCENNRITNCNQAALKLFGFKDKLHFQKQQIWEILPKHQADGLTSQEKVRQLAALATTQGSQWFEWSHRRLNGDIFPADVLLTSVIKQETIQLNFIIREITERKLAEDNLKRSEKLLDAMGSVAKVGGWELKIDTMVLRWTKELYRLLEVNQDYKPDIQRAIAFYSPESKPIIEAAIKNAIEFGKPFDLEEYVTTAKGNHRAVRAVGRAYRENGKIKTIFGTFQDITESKAAEEALKESQDRLQKFHDAAFEGIAIVELGKVKDLNDRIAQLLGYKRSELLGMEMSSLVHPEDLDMVQENIKLELETPYLARLVHKDSSIKHMEVRGHYANVEGRRVRVSTFNDVTESKAAQDALEASEQNYRLLADNVTDVIWTADLKGSTTYVSPSVFNYRGITVEEAVEQTIFDSLAPESAIIVKKRLAAEIEREADPLTDPHRSATLVVEQLRKDGTTFWGEVRTTFLRDSNGKPIGLLGISRDVTERKEAEEMLSDVAAGFTAATGKEFFTSLTKHIQASLNLDYVMISQISREDPEIADTLAVCAKGQTIDNISYGLPGTPCEEVVSGKICFHPDGVQQDFPEDKLLVEMGVNSYMGIPLWASNGKPLGLMALLHSGPFPNEELARSMLKIFSVRTAGELERMQAEEMTQRLVTAIAQAEEHIMITSRNGDIEYVNPAFEQITGYSSEEVLGRNPRFLCSGEHEKSFYQNLWKTIEGGKVWKGNFINMKKDGSKFQEEATISPVVDESGQITNYVAVKRDVTKERQLENQLRQTQKMEAIGTLAGGIAHDFNNILFAILGNADMLQEQLMEEGREFEEIKEIITAGNRAKDLVAQILAFARKADPKRVQVDLCLLVKEVSKLIRSIFPSTIEVITKLETDKAILRADPTNMHQVLMNLCTNAHHAMLVSGGKLVLSVTSKEIDEESAELHGLGIPGSHIVLEISDTGGGIPKHIVERIFEPFFTTKGKNEGTGLGLSMAHGIIADLGGAICVYSEPGVGTTFRVFLPSAQGKGVEEPGINEGIPRGSENVLIVDDETAVAQTTGKIMSGLGYSVETKTSGSKALAAFKLAPTKFDLLITDQTMPGITGVELASQALEVRPDLPIILCSGFSESVTQEKAKQLGIRQFLTKPFSKRELAEAVRNSLDNQNSRLA